MTGKPMSVAQGTAYIFASRAVALLTGFALQVGMARMLGIEDYGLYGLILTMVAWAELVFWGINQTVTMLTAREPQSARWLEKWFFRHLWPVLAGMLLVAGCLVVLFPTVMRQSDSYAFIALGFADLPAMALFCLYLGLLNGLRRFKDMALSYAVYYLARMLISFTLVSLGLSLYGALLGNLACSFIGLALAVPLFRAHASRGVKERETTVKTMVRTTLPFVSLALAFNVSLYINLWLVGAWGSGEELGLYNAAFSLSRIVFVLLSSLSPALFPAAVSSLAGRDMEDFRRMVRQSFRFIVMVSVPLTLYGVIAADPLMGVFGEKYQAGAAALRLLMPGFTLAAFLFVLNFVHMARGRYRLVVGCNLAVVAVEIAACWLLMPRMGYQAAGLAFILAMASGIVMELATVREDNHMLPGLRTVGSICMCAAFSAVPLYFAGSLWTTVAASVPCVALYFSLLLVSGSISLDELRLPGGGAASRHPS